jgi:hypothetical protein
VTVRNRIAIIAVVLAVLGGLATWGVVAHQHDSTSVAEPRGRDAHDPDRGEVDDPDGADPDAGEGGESAAIRNALDWYYGQRTVPAKQLPAGALDAAFVQAAAIPAAGPDGTAKTTPVWHRAGPSPIDMSTFTINGRSAGYGSVAGRVTSLAVAPGGTDVAYAGAADGGVWKTTDGGTTWTFVTEALPTQAVGAITINPRNASDIWIGTGEANNSGDSYYGAGVWESSDAGATWVKRGGKVLDDTTISRIVIAPRNILVASNHGLYRSTNNGKTFAQVLAPGGTADPAGNFVTDVGIVPATSNAQVLAAVGYYRGNAGNGLWLSTDSGQTFSRLSPSGFAPQGNIGRTTFALTKKAEYAVVQDAPLLNAGSGTDGLNGVYRSTSGPNGPWTRVATGTSLIDSNSQISSCYGEHPGVQSWYDQYVAIDPTDPDHVVLGLEEIYQTADGGTTWHTIGRYSDFCGASGSTTHPDQHAGAFAVSGGVPTFYAANDGGVWKQSGTAFTNDGWTDLSSTLSITQPYDVAASAAPNPVYIAGTQDNGTVSAAAGTKTWTEIHGGDGADVAIAPDNPATMYAEYPYGDMYVSTNSGTSWAHIAPPDSERRFVAPFELDPTDATHLVALGRHVWESHNAPTSFWSSVYDNGAGHDGTALAVQGSTIYEGWCGPCNPSALNTENGFVRGLATNQGGSWHAVTATGLPNRYITGLLVDPANSAHVYVTVSGFSSRWIPTASQGHVFESTDGGASFTDISGNLPDAPANDLVLSRNHVVVATDVGVFEQFATGTWRKLGTGMPKASVLDLVVVPNSHRILAATHGLGVWSLNA